MLDGSGVRVVVLGGGCVLGGGAGVFVRGGVKMFVS